MAGRRSSRVSTEGPRGIRCNVVVPGPIDNSFQLEIEHRIPLRRYGPANDMAQTVPFLASDMSDFSTEEVLIADGGMAGQQRALCGSARIDLGIVR
ncbi:MAG: SDR family oxidoreductase [Alphaproteobacteria bacterium]|nr:SDR family oxidoreductase [Alphaproteobacteria bacterium]